MATTEGTTTNEIGGAAAIPLLRRWPALARLPRRALCTLPTPVDDARALAPGLWIKRDDLSADPVGGNKPRALEFLLGAVGPGDEVVTVGGRASTHVFAVAEHAARLDARVSAYRWWQEMNPMAERVERAIAAGVARVRDVWTPPGAVVRAGIRVLRGARWIPAGGTSPLGMLGQVNAALELADQIAAGVLPRPERIVLPLGSGGTTAGLLVGLAAAGVDTQVIGVQVVPRIVANRGHVMRLAWSTRRFIRGITGAEVPRVSWKQLAIDRRHYGGAYGRATPAARDAAARYAAWSGRTLDLTYGGKALAAALAGADGRPTLFWLTFDARFADSHPETP